MVNYGYRIPKLLVGFKKSSFVHIFISLGRFSMHIG